MSNFFGWVCQHGLLIARGVKPGPTGQVPVQWDKWSGPLDPAAVAAAGGVLLGPPGDRIVQQNGSPTFLPIELHGLDAEIEAMQARAREGRIDAGVAAFSHYGPAPPRQEKPSNQDFAMACSLVTADGPLSVGIVCDGVSTSTFWPERASRIAAFAALKAVKAFFAQFPMKQVPPGGQAPHTLTSLVRRFVIEDFERDRELIVKSGVTPPIWAPEYYRKVSVSKREEWYKTTLLIGCLGVDDGFVLYSGDGGIMELLKPSGEQLTALTPNALLATDDSLAISQFASLNYANSQFSQALLASPGAFERSLMLSSDGFDRSVQKVAPTAYGDMDLALKRGDHAKALSQLISLTQQQDADLDNMSVVWLRSPQSGHAKALPQGAALWVAEPAPAAVQQRPPVPPAPSISGAATGASAVSAPPVHQDLAMERATGAWQMAERLGSVKAYEAFVDLYPQAHQSEAARAALAEESSRRDLAKRSIARSRQKRRALLGLILGLVTSAVVVGFAWHVWQGSALRQQPIPSAPPPRGVQNPERHEASVPEVPSAASGPSGGPTGAVTVPESQPTTLPPVATPSNQAPPRAAQRAPVPRAAPTPTNAPAAEQTSNEPQPPAPPQSDVSDSSEVSSAPVSPAQSTEPPTSSPPDAPTQNQGSDTPPAG